jgi:hypothetical protein
MVETTDTSDNYVSNLSEALKQKAKDELRETDQLREEYLIKFKDWIAKNPRIKNCRTDNAFLLRFLRVRKFNFSAACQTLERYLATRQLHPEWFQNLDISDPKLEEILQAGMCLLLRRSNDLEPATIFRTAAHFDRKFQSSDVVKLYIMLFEMLAEDEAVQINGISLYSDDSQAPMDYYMLLSLSEWKEIFDFWQNTLPMRFKRCTVGSVPEFARKILNFILGLCTEKIRKRFHVSGHFDIYISANA